MMQGGNGAGLENIQLAFAHRPFHILGTAENPDRFFSPMIQRFCILFKLSGALIAVFYGIYAKAAIAFFSRYQRFPHTAYKAARHISRPGGDRIRSKQHPCIVGRDKTLYHNADAPLFCTPALCIYCGTGIVPGSCNCSYGIRDFLCGNIQHCIIGAGKGILRAVLACG